MRITFLCCNHSLGDERVVAREAMSLAQAGHEVVVLGRGDADKKLPEHPRLKLVSVMPLLRGASVKGKLQRLRVLTRMRRLALESRPHVIGAHEPDSAWLALALRRRTGVPVHFDIHECFEEMAAARAPRSLQGAVRRTVWGGMSYLGRRADWLTVVSPVTARQFSRLRTDGRVDVLHNSPPIDLFPECSQPTEGPITLCHEGWLDRSRGMRPLLEAFALARQSVPVKLLLVGKVRNGCEAEFDTLVKQLDLAGDLEVTGWVPYREVGKIDARAQIGLVTLQASGNNFGSLSNKLYSYMACGQAVIVPAGSATGEMVRDYDCGIAVDVGQPRQIADAIIHLCRDSQRRMACGRNARRAIETKLGWRHMEKLLFRVYETLGRGNGRD